MFRIAISKLFILIFARVLACHSGGPGSIPGREMVVSGTLEEDRDDLGQASP